MDLAKLKEEQIINYLFIYPRLQNNLMNELKKYPFKNKICLEMVELLDSYIIKYKNTLDKDNFLFLSKEKENIKEFNEIIHKDYDKVDIELYLKLLTEQIREFKLSDFKKQLSTSNLEDIEKISKKMKELELFNLSFDSELVSFKNVKKIKELEKLKQKNGFLTGYPEIDKYVKVNGGFTGGSVTTFIAPPHTGKCVTGDTKVIIELINKDVEEIEIKKLFDKKYSFL